MNSQREAQQSRLARRNRIAIVVGLLIVQALTAWLISAQARSDTETSQRHLFTEVCLRNNITKGVMRVNEVRRLALTRGITRDAVRVAHPGASRLELAGLVEESPSVKLARSGVRQVNDLLPILNCDATFEHVRDGRFEGVRLPQPVVSDYLRLIGERWVPQLRGSSIVGRHRAEQGAADF